MCIYTVEMETLKKIKIPHWGCVTPPNIPKLGISGLKDTTKTNKAWSMLCDIQVEYSVVFHRNLSL